MDGWVDGWMDGWQKPPAGFQSPTLLLLINVVAVVANITASAWATNVAPRHSPCSWLGGELLKDDNVEHILRHNHNIHHCRRSFNAPSLQPEQ